MTGDDRITIVQLVDAGNQLADALTAPELTARERAGVIEDWQRLITRIAATQAQQRREQSGDERTDTDA